MARMLDTIKNNKLFKKTVYCLLIAFVFLYTFSIPTFSGNSFYLISYIFMAALIIVATLYYIFYKKIFFDKRPFFIFAFAVETIIATSIYTHSFRNWFSIVLMSITLVVFYYSFRAIDNQKMIIKIIVFAFAMFGLIFAIFYRDKIFHLDLSLRLGNDFDNVNLIGTYFSIGASLSYYLAFMFKKKRELLYFVLTILFLYLGLFTGSRTFLATTGIAFIFVTYMRFKQKKWLFFVIVGLLAIFFIILINMPFLAFLKEQFIRMLAAFGIGNGKVDSSTVERVTWQKYGFFLGSRNLIFGLGVDGFATYSTVGTYTHNNYAEVLCDFGVVGLILFYIPFAFSAVLSAKTKNDISKITIPIVALYLVKGLFGVYYCYKDAYLMMALCLYLTSDYTFGPFKQIEIGRKKETNEELLI